jgi:hypothetical protein
MNDRSSSEIIIWDSPFRFRVRHNVIHIGVLVLVEHHLDAVGGDFVHIPIALAIHVHGDILAGFRIFDGVVTLVVVINTGLHIHLGEMGQFTVPHQLRHIFGGGETLQMPGGNFTAKLVVNVYQPVATFLRHRYGLSLGLAVGRTKGLKIESKVSSISLSPQSSRTYIAIVAADVFHSGIAQVRVTVIRRFFHSHRFGGIVAQQKHRR